MAQVNIPFFIDNKPVFHNFFIHDFLPVRKINGNRYV